MKNALPFYQRESFIYLFAVVTSFILSIIVARGQDIINPDAVCYLSSAQMIGNEVLQQAMHLCSQANWPFYSLLIYGFVKFTHVSYVMAGYTIDAVFSALSVFLFISIVKKLGGSRRILWLAALTILLSHEFNNVR